MTSNNPYDPANQPAPADAPPPRAADAPPTQAVDAAPATVVGPHAAAVDAPARTEQPPARTTGAVVAAEDTTQRDAQRRRELNRFRGFNFGAACFGWLVVIGIAVLLTAILGAAGAAIGLTQATVASNLSNNATALTIAGAVLLLVVLAIAYYTGGYVAGRLSRFSGGVQGVGVWVIGLLVTVGLAIGGAVAGSKYNVLDQLRLPSIPVNGQSFASGAAITLAIIAVVTLLAAVLGGTVGLRYHHRVDRAIDRAA